MTKRKEEFAPFDTNDEDFGNFLEEWPEIFEHNEKGVRLNQKFVKFYNQREEEIIKDIVSNYDERGKTEGLTYGQIVMETDVKIILAYVGKALDKNIIFYLSHTVRGYLNLNLSSEQRAIFEKAVRPKTSQKAE